MAKNTKEKKFPIWLGQRNGHCERMLGQGGEWGGWLGGVVNWYTSSERQCVNLYQKLKT